MRHNQCDESVLHLFNNSCKTMNIHVTLIVHDLLNNVLWYLGILTQFNSYTLYDMRCFRLIFTLWQQNHCCHCKNLTLYHLLKVTNLNIKFYSRNVLGQTGNKIYFLANLQCSHECPAPAHCIIYLYSD